VCPRDYEISQRRACVLLIGVDPKTVRRERLPDHSAIRDAMKAVAGKRRRFIVGSASCWNARG
jgi:putative transposase